MSLINRLLDAVRSWRRPEGRKARKRADVKIEHLDHRRLISANFTGIATTDIPNTSGPGYAIVTNNVPLVINNPQLAAAIKVSGFAIDAIRMQYDPTDDTLSVAIQQPLNQKTTPQYPVIAGDADNNQNSGGTPDAAVLAAAPLFQDYYDLGGSETMAVFFDFNHDSIPDVVAGIPNTPGAGKLFTVNQAVVNSDPLLASTTAPSFGDSPALARGVRLSAQLGDQSGLRVHDHEFLQALRGADGAALRGRQHDGRGGLRRVEHGLHQ